jgi:hypothetical protein
MVMRLLIVAVVSLVAACDQKSKPTTAPDPKLATAGVQGLVGADEATPRVGGGLARVPKKPLDTKPLPPLVKDPGGATGKPVRGLGFGGLGIDTPRAIALAPNGDLYVAGHFDGELDAGPLGKFKPTEPAPNKDPKKKVVPTTDAYLAKIGADGKLTWMQTWGAKRDDVARGVAVNGDTIVVVGNFLDELVIGKRAEGAAENPAANSDDLYAAAFDKTGKSIWVWTAGGIDSDGANAVAAAPDGGWYVAGSFMKTVSFVANGVEFKSKGGTDAFLVKLAKTGEVEWVKQYGGAYNDTILHVAVDAQGSVYVQGHFMDKADWGAPAPLVAAGGKDNDIVLAKYDANGDHVWSKRFGNQFDDVAGGLTVDPAGNVTMVGSFDKSVSFGEGDEHVSNGEADIYVARFDGTGKLDWAKTYGGDRADVGWGVAADAAGNTVMTGWFENTVDFGKTTLGAITSKGNKDVFAIKHDPAGNVVWVQTWGDKDHDQGRAVAIDAKGGAIIAGLYRFTMSFVSPPLESVRAADDRIPKPDTFVVRLER